MSRQTIPVQIDSIKKFTGTEKSTRYDRTRCIYYRVEVVEGYVLRNTQSILGTRASFAAGSNWAVLTGPEQIGKAEPFFLFPELITRTINAIHANAELSLEFGYLWVPHKLLREGFVGEPIREGDLYRLSLPYFLHCYRFVTERITEDEWLNPDQRFSKRIQPSPQETLAFREWRQQQILISREHYHQPEYVQHRLPKKQEDL